MDSPSETTFQPERAGPALVTYASVPGFADLSREDRLLAYRLSNAAIAGRDIVFDQHHRHGLAVRALCETLVGKKNELPAEAPDPLRTYLKLLWLNNGCYDHITSRKFIPDISPEQFEKALMVRQGADARLLSDIFRTLRKTMFDPDFEPVMTNKTPGEDWIRNSAVNYYDRSLTLETVSRWADAGHELHPLNSSLVLKEGSITEEIWRAGCEGIPGGKYGRELNTVAARLRIAAECGSAGQRETILRLIRYLETGDPDDFRSYCIRWVGEHSPVDFNLGFIEVYLDPRARKGEWQASVYCVNREHTRLMNGIAALTHWFEARMPWKDDYKKSGSTVPVADVVDAIVQTGGTGPISPVGINLPNEQWIRERHGSKSILLHNISAAHDKAVGRTLVGEFACDEDEIAMDGTYGVKADLLHTALHEIIGHGSGRVSGRLGSTDPSALLPGLYSTIEEARADCVALWCCPDERLLEAGVAASREELRAIAAVLYRQMIRSALTQLRLVGDHDRLEEDHMKNRQLIVHYLLEHSDAVRREERDGKTFYRLVDLDRARECVGRLLGELMRIKAEGDAGAAEQLVNRYGLRFEQSLRNEIGRRAERLNLPLYVAFVQSEFRHVLDSDGNIVDVEITPPADLASQMNGYSPEPMRILSALQPRLE